MHYNYLYIAYTRNICKKLLKLNNFNNITINNTILYMNVVQDNRILRKF